MNLKTLTVLSVFLSVNNLTTCCDLDELISDKEISIEDALSKADIAFRGISRPIKNSNSGIFVSYFDLITVYKGEPYLREWRKLNNYFREINVTFPTRSGECLTGNKVPREYVVFANLMEDEIRAGSVAKWDENADLRVWKSLGWSKWNDWSPCSVSCSSGIQQRTRHCLQSKCSGFNIQQRHCNLFNCNETVTPLNIKDSKFFHPSRERWQPVPDRPTAWRLTPNSYIWIPAVLLFPDEECHRILQEFSLALTLRIPHNVSLGTIFSLRSRSKQRNYLSLELAGADLKLIHATESGTDVVRIPAGLDNSQWHQIGLSIRDGSIMDVFVDCEWSRTEILLAHSLDVPADCDIIVGYLFTGDIEQVSIIKNAHAANLQCSSTLIPIEDPDVRYTTDGFKLFAGKNAAKSRKHRY